MLQSLKMDAQTLMEMLYDARHIVTIEEGERFF